METVIWNDQFSVNIKEIDDQHKRFLSFLKEAYSKMDRSLDAGELNPLLERLVEHAKEHFATEEKYFAKFKYEYADAHAELHRKLMGEILAFKKRHSSDNSIGLTTELVDFLEDWLLIHIMKNDKQYMEVFHENGLR